jgi:hypothetical protein
MPRRYTGPTSKFFTDEAGKTRPITESDDTPSVTISRERSGPYESMLNHVKPYLESLARVSRKPPGGHHSPPSFILAYGRTYESKVMSKAEADDVVADATHLRLVRKACFSNAIQLALVHPEKYTYVEGYVASGTIPLEHAWVVDREGRVIDITLQNRRRSSREIRREIRDAGLVPSLDPKSNIFGKIPVGWEYVGVPIRADYLLNYVETHRSVGSVIDDYRKDYPILRMNRRSLEEKVLS